MVLGRAMGSLEGAFGAVWSVGEVALGAWQGGAWTPDEHRHAVKEDVQRRGFYVPVDPGSLDLALGRDGWITGSNPYRRVAPRSPDRIRGHLRRGRTGGGTLVMVCHCYGVPSPRAMAILFGLDALGVDVCTNIMGFHQPGTYRAWPGSGLVDARCSTTVENLRASITGARALAMWLRQRHGYDDVVVLGFSIGGHLALHLANAGAADRVVAYAPVARVHVTLRELGLMPYFHPGLDWAARRVDPEYDVFDLGVADPLTHELAIPPEQLHVVVQRHDRLATPAQIAAIRRRHPSSRHYELGGTHIYPAGLRQLHGIVRDVVRGGA